MLCNSMARERGDRLAMSTPAASVVIPTYQRRELVVEAVQSVVAQTEPLFELIVVDDDGTTAPPRH